MKLIGNICFVAFVIWIASFFFKSEAKELPTNETLISQFEKQNVLKKDEWEKGDVVEGIQVYSALTEGDGVKNAWLLGVKQAGVFSVSPRSDPAFSKKAALSTCYKLVKGVMARDDSEDLDIVAKAFKYAFNSEPVDNTKRDAEIIDGYKFEVQMGPIASNLYSYACTMKPK
ncbi:TPA: hypothetical protein O4G09_004001 [Klebsiella michiganensis]|nr:hypothetical protein [Klebsiella michiganensis]